MKKSLLTITGVAVLLLFALNGCKKEDPGPDPAAKLVSPGKQITSFKIVTPAVTGIIDTTAKTISIALPGGTAVTALTTDITIAAGHTISPNSGVAQNFTNPVIYTVTRPNNTTTAWTVSVSSQVVTIENDITQSVTWTSDKIYVINGDVNIGNNSVLTIQPGTVIKFNGGSSLSIGYSSNGTIIANGTATSPITFTSSAALPTAGAWEGLFFYDKTLSNSSLSYCNVMYAGSNGSYGAVNLIGCDLAINYCNISLSGSYGINTTYQNSKGGFVTFANNTISTTAKFGLVIDAHKLGTVGTANVFTNVNGISIYGDYNSTTPQTWRNLNTPYIISTEVDIDGSLTIEPGTRFKFESGGWLGVGYYNNTTLIADGGSSATPITFTSNSASPVAGAWRGIVFYGKTQTNTKMNFCVIEYAGNGSYGAVTLNDIASFTFTNNTIRNSASYGVNVTDVDAGFQSFQNNTISSCANHVIVISTKHLPELGTPNTLTAATGKGINIYGDAQYLAPVVWKKQTADFYVTSGEVDIDGFLTLEAGSTFLFASDSYFYFGYYAGTKITAVGTSTNKITFTSSSLTPVPGSWKGFVFDDNFTQASSELNYCQFNYTGLSAKPAIYTSVSFPVSNTTIGNFSSTHAAEYKTGITAPSGTGNNFTWFAN